MALKNLFYPKSIAIIGASRESGKLGNDVLKNILSFGYKGKVYPVNPKAKKILGKKCYPSVLEIKEKIDLALIIIPAPLVPLALEECGKRGIAAVAVISAGFKEIGAEGKKLEDKLVKIAKKYKISLLGPNCLGIINVDISLNASFAYGMPQKGKVSFVSQSGAMAVAFLDQAKKYGLGFSKVVSLGNKAILSENEILKYFESDNKTKVVAMYLESISDGKKFLEIAKKFSAKKPIIGIKSGTTAQAAKAISFHTGSLAGSSEAVSTAFEQIGIIRVYNTDDLFNLSKVFSCQPLPKGKNIAIVTNAGGLGVMAVDSFGNLKIGLAEFSKKTENTLKKYLPKAASAKNPIDVVGDAKADRYESSLKAVLEDKNVFGVIVILTPQTMTEVEETAKIIAKLNKKYKDKPVLCSFVGGFRVADGIEILNKNRIPNFLHPEKAVWAMDKMWNYYREKNESKKISRVKFLADKDSFKRVKDILQKNKNRNQQLISGNEALEIFKNYNLSILQSGLAKNVEEGIKIAKKINYPVALKVVSPDIIHKTDVGGVKVGISGEKEFRPSFFEILKNIGRKAPKAKVKGILVQKMAKEGTEVILGARRDLYFGALLMFGLGGIYTEIIKDISFRVPPISQEEAKEMILEIKGRKIIEGFRGRPPLDIDIISKSLCYISQLILDFPEIDQIDINPFVVFQKGRGGAVVDGRLLLK